LQKKSIWCSRKKRCILDDADDAVRARLHHYIAARQQNSFGNSSDAANTTSSGISSTTHQLHIQPLCLTGSPTASSSPGMASSGNLSVPATHTPPLGTLTGAAAHAYFFVPGLRTLSGSGSGSGSGQFDAGQLGTRPLGAAPAGPQLDLSKLAATQPAISQEVAQLLAGAFAARATATAGDRLEPNRRLTDKENSACIAFDEMSMGRQEASSLAEAASNLKENLQLRRLPACACAGIYCCTGQDNCAAHSPFGLCAKKLVSK
jgi:hypothetical protein